MDIEQWFRGIPPVTRAYLCVTVAMAVAVSFDFVEVYQVVYSPRLAFHRGQWWRCFTSFLFADQLGINLFFYLHFTYMFMISLEEHFYHRRKEEFIFLLVAACASLIGLTLVVPSMELLLLSHPLRILLVYIWSKRFPDEHLSLFGLVPMSAPTFPFVLLALHMTMFGVKSAVYDGSALFLGHVLWFMADVAPQISGVNLMDPIGLLKKIVTAAPPAPPLQQQQPQQHQREEARGPE